MGPLAGIRVVEFAGIGPAPFCGMVLSDLGADVVRIDRIPGPPSDGPPTGMATLTEGILGRGRRSVGVDLKHPDGQAVAADLVAGADALTEGFRPGVMERLGFGPDACLERNPRLVYGRLTGWGQDGPYAQAAGHDLNYIALAGALAPIGRRGQRPWRRGRRGCPVDRGERAFSRTPAAVARPAPVEGEHTDQVLAEAGLPPDRIDALRASGAVG